MIRRKPLYSFPERVKHFPVRATTGFFSRRTPRIKTFLQKTMIHSSSDGFSSAPRRHTSTGVRTLTRTHAHNCACIVPTIASSQTEVWKISLIKAVFPLQVANHSASSLDTWQSFPCSWHGKKMLSLSLLLSSSERWTLEEDVGWKTGQSRSSSSSTSYLSVSAVLLSASTVGPTWPVNWLSKLKMTVPGLWKWTGPTEAKNLKI